MAPRDVRPTTSCARQPVQRPDQAAVAPAPAPSARLEVIVVGGGLSGLCCAAICSKMQGKKRIRVYDRGNAKKDLRVVNLQSSTWSKFPEELQERLKTISSSQWPCQRESPRSLGRPRSLFAYQLKEELERMAQVEMHQGPPELEDPCHALVLADGPDARHLRREHFGTSAVSAASLTALGCAVSDVESDSNLATVLSCAQRRFALNLAGDAGLLSMVLTDDEIKEVQGAKGTLQKVKAWETMKEGYRLFGLSDSSIGEPVVLSTHLQGQQRYFTELNSFDAPAATIATVQHPWAFLVGEAAGLVNIWPGRALNAMVKSSLVLAQHLKAMAQAVRAGYPVDESFSMEYGEQLTKLHGFEAGVYSRQCEAAQTRSKSFRLSTCLQEAKATEPAQQVSALAIFRRTLRGSGRWLEKNEEKDEEKDEKFEEALWRGVKEANLDARTLTLFNASGSWFLDPPLSEAEPEKEKIVPEVTVQEMEAAGRSSYNRALRLYRAKQLPEAAQGFRAAALHGHGKGAYALGVMLLNGEGVKKDELSAAQFLHQAAQKGENKAMYNLALMTLS
ncbi:unnamed protein product [Durusdinium trenchii]|uniref:Uncharacterized protein n=1 Tax=Durusdinium trenchii TaxID=1381693 RepID=A0ABP0MEI6_9DINO